MVRSDRYVAKWGGTSLANLSQARKVLDIICEDDRRSLVVVSAPGKRFANDHKITDMLLSLHKAQGEKRADLFTRVCERFSDIARILPHHFDPRFELRAIEKKVLPRDQTPDFVASRGEWLMARILAKALEHRGFVFLDATEIMRFNRHGVLDKNHAIKASKMLRHAKARYVIPGFYAGRAGGGVQLLPRGGSDLTGAIVAALARVPVYENWTDVSGMLMADPRIVSNPKTIPWLTYKEVRELSYNGATVLHEDVMLFVRNAKTTIRIGNTNHPDQNGTLIIPDDENIVMLPGRPPGSITGVSGRQGFSTVRMSKAMMNKEVGFLGKVGGVFAEHGVSIEHMPDGIDDLSVIVDTKSFKKKQRVIREQLMDTCRPESFKIEHGFALICVVGKAMAYTPGVVAKLAPAIAAVGANLHCIIQGASEISITIAVAEGDYEKTVRAIYDTCA